MRRNFITGFTLAEVLVTLTIIGVIAALTIPALIQDIQDAQYKTAYKKAFSMVNQAITKAYTNNLLSPMTNQFDLVGTVYVNFNAFRNQFVVTKSCPYDAYNCWNTSGEFMTVPGNIPLSQCSAFIDNSGMAWTMYSDEEAMMMVDTNGDKPPNHYGKDRWFFKLVDINGSRGAGIPIKAVPYIGDVYASSWYCHYPPCYYIKWLEQ